ncbi:glycoside hydrolase superfamily [Xylariaceae sp. FL1272]|nr:glycoside hydrolase superfamily [Xylariaceae sp. FL1272]
MARFAFTLLSVSTLLCSLASAAFDITSKNNVAVYYGQGPNQKSITTYCADPTIDVIILSFVNLFPAQANGYPGTNFGNQCWATAYSGPGSDHTKDKLLMCPSLAQDLYTCRQISDKKILLSLGGDPAAAAYQLTGASAGTAFADLLWGIFGPRDSAWVAAGKPRPFDYTNSTAGDGIVRQFSVDGFDLDIERAPTDSSAGYIALAKRLRALYATNGDKNWYLTASPQCTVPDANVGPTLQAVKFDMLFVQFYNTAACSARSWVTANKNYVPGGTELSSGFSYKTWDAWLTSTTYNKATPILITLPGSNSAATSGAYISVANTVQLASAYYCNSRFAGIGAWDATRAEESIASGRYFFQNAKVTLKAAGLDTRLSCVKVTA